MTNIFKLSGGSDPRKAGDMPVPTTSTYVLDLSTKEWKRVSDMAVARMNHSACCLLGMVYAIGGNGSHSKYVHSFFFK